jgi:hypothetical protein
LLQPVAADGQADGHARGAKKKSDAGRVGHLD